MMLHELAHSILIRDGSFSWYDHQSEGIMQGWPHEDLRFEEAGGKDLKYDEETQRKLRVALGWG